MKALLLSDLGLERIQSLLALAYRDPKNPFYHDEEIKDLHSQAVSLSDDNAEYLTPNYPMPAIPNEVHLLPLWKRLNAILHHN